MSAVSDDAALTEPVDHRQSCFCGQAASLIAGLDDPCEVGLQQTIDLFDGCLHITDRAVRTEQIDDPVAPPLLPVSGGTYGLSSILPLQLFQRRWFTADELIESGVGEDIDHHLGMGRRERLKAATRRRERFNTWPYHSPILIQGPSVLGIHCNNPAMTQAHALVQRHIEAFNTHDVDALLADFTSTATWVTGDYSVPAGELREFFAGAMEALTPQLELRRVIDGGAVVAAEMNEVWTHHDRAKTAALIAVFDLSEGMIARAKIYREGSADA